MVRFVVKELAQQRGIETAADLAREVTRSGANIGQSTVYNIWDNKRNDFNLSTLRAIASVLDVPISQLYTENGEAKITTPRFVAA